MTYRKISVIALLCFSAVLFFGAKAPGKFKVSGSITQTQEVLSGIRPTEEMEKEWKRPKPYANKTMYVRLGSTNKYTKKVFRKFTTDSAGRFSIMLPPGKYCLVQQPKRDRLKIPDYSAQNKQLRNFEQYQVGDKKCFDEWYAACDTTIEVKDKDISGLTFNIHFGWNPPCVSGGPIPQ